MKKITILTSCIETSCFARGKQGVLVEWATDSKIGNNFQDAIPIETLTGIQEDLRRLASHLATKILVDEPLFRGIPQLTVFHEVICVELYKIFRIIHLHDYLIRENYQICEFASISWWGDELSKLINIIGSPLKILLPGSTKKISKIEKCFDLAISNRFSFKKIFPELLNGLNQLDPFHRRSMLFRKFETNKAETNKIWFYTTAVNYTNIGLLYESYFPEKFNFLVEDKITGGKPLIKNNRSFSSLYAYAYPNFIPSRQETKKVATEIYQHIAHAALDTSETIACKMLIASSWFSIFLSRLLPNGLFTSSIFENWINKVEPSAVVVGNQVFEGYSLFKAKENKIPTILLQHGVLQDFYRYSDHPVDHYIVRGEFFYKRLSDASQQRALILNPPSNHMTKAKNKSRTKIIFMTMPLFLLPIEVEIDSILLTLIKAMSETTLELVVRVHPLEKIDDYKAKIEILLEQIPCNLKVEYNQGDKLEYLLDHAVAAVMFGSTIFLDCIRYDVPVISFDWHDFGFKNSIKPHGIFNFAKNLVDLHRLLKQAFSGELSGQVNHINFFLANSTQEEMKHQFMQLLN